MISSSCWNSLISHAKLTEGAALPVRGPKLTGANCGAKTDLHWPTKSPPVEGKLHSAPGKPKISRYLFETCHQGVINVWL